MNIYKTFHWVDKIFGSCLQQKSGSMMLKRVWYPVSNVELNKKPCIVLFKQNKHKRGENCIYSEALRE